MDSRGQVQVPERGLQPQNSSVAFIPPQREESPLPTLRPPLGLAPVSPEPAWSSRRRSLPPQKPPILRFGDFCALPPRRLTASPLVQTQVRARVRAPPTSSWTTPRGRPVRAHPSSSTRPSSSARRPRSLRSIRGVTGSCRSARTSQGPREAQVSPVSHGSGRLLHAHAHAHPHVTHRTRTRHSTRTHIAHIKPRAEHVHTVSRTHHAPRILRTLS